MTTKLPFLPSAPWKLILEFNDTSHIRLKAKTIAKACAMIAGPFIAEHRKRLTNLTRSNQAICFNTSSFAGLFWTHACLRTSYIPSLKIYEQTPVWRISTKSIYHNIIKDTDPNHFRYINNGYVSITSLYNNQLKRLLKANGVKGYSKMNRAELLHTYLKV